MKRENIFWKFFKWLLKLAWKLFILLLCGSLSITEVVLHHVNIYLKKIIS